VIIDGVWIGNWIYLTLADRNYELSIALSLIYTLYNSLQHAQSLLNLLCLHRLSPSNSFQHRSFLRGSVFTSLLAGECLTTNSLFQLTPRLAAISHQPPAVLTGVSNSLISAAAPRHIASARTAQITPRPTVLLLRSCLLLPLPCLFCGRYLATGPHVTVIYSGETRACSDRDKKKIRSNTDVNNNRLFG
jgi:hypothetical protein